MTSPQQLLHNLIQQGVPVDMPNADLSGITFSSVRLQGAKLSGANLRAADLSGGYLSHCDLQRASLQKARLVLGDFRGANFADADLRSADLTSAVLSGANLVDTDLSRAKLVKARLDGADLTGANLNQTDLRGAQGWTVEQLLSAKNNNKAILDAKMLAALGRDGDLAIARHGKKKKERPKPYEVDLLFADPKPKFGDLFLICGDEHPLYPPTGNFGFEKLADLQVEQVDDYFGIRGAGDPTIWISPLVGGEVVEHHPGPFDGLRLELTEPSEKKLWTTCLARFRAALNVH